MSTCERVHRAIGQDSSRRKKEHLDIALCENLELDEIETGLGDLRFVHQALPELDLASVDLSTELFGRTLKAPLFVSSMVGGVEPARRTNRNLAITVKEEGLVNMTLLHRPRRGMLT